MALTIATSKMRLDKILTNLIVRYRSNTFIFESVLPTKAVKNESDAYRIFLPTGYFKGAPIKADGARTSEAAPAFDEDTYRCQERAIKGLVTDRAVQNADAPVNPMIEMTNLLNEKVSLSMEIDRSDLVISTLAAQGASGKRQLTPASTDWASASANIPDDISVARRALTRNIGQKPNILVMNTDAYETMVNATSIAGKMQYTTVAQITDDMPVKSLRGLSIKLADAVINTADEGQTASYKSILVDNAGTEHVCVIMAYVSGSSDVNFGCTFVSRSQRVYRWRGSEGEDRGGEFIKVSSIYTPKITNVSAGFIITKVLGNSDSI